MDWYNEPPQWAARDGTVTMHSASKTDFWRLTGIARDSGHFYYRLLRQAYFSLADAMDVGLMCASPEGPGFSVTFESVTIQNL